MPKVWKNFIADSVILYFRPITGFTPRLANSFETNEPSYHN